MAYLESPISFVRNLFQERSNRIPEEFKGPLTFVLFNFFFFLIPELNTLFVSIRAEKNFFNNNFFHFGTNSNKCD